MKILICTGVYPPDIGGPAKYAKNLADEFSKFGHKVRVIFYKIEKKIPTGFRHLVYFFRIFIFVFKSDAILVLDTFSVGLPAVLLAMIFRKKIAVRISGDFLWENYVENTGALIILRKFYENMPALSFKHKTILALSKFVLKNSSANIFTTQWQKEIFEKYYGLDKDKNFVVENFYGAKFFDAEISDETKKEKIFLCAGRRIKLKNLELLEIVFNQISKQNPEIKLEIIFGAEQEQMEKKIKNSYAVILSSLSDISPNFILESLQAGKPFILTKETGLRDRLENYGLFVNPLDKEDIKNKILFLVQPENYKEFRNRIKEFNFTHSWEEIAGEFLDVLTSGAA